MCNQNEPKATLVTFGAPESLATSNYSGLPRPIQIERIAGDTDIESLARQVYLLSQSGRSGFNPTEVLLKPCSIMALQWLIALDIGP